MVEGSVGGQELTNSYLVGSVAFPPQAPAGQYVVELSYASRKTSFPVTVVAPRSSSVVARMPGQCDGPVRLAPTTVATCLGANGDTYVTEWADGGSIQLQSGSRLWETQAGLLITVDGGAGWLPGNASITTWVPTAVPLPSAPLALGATENALAVVSASAISVYDARDLSRPPSVFAVPDTYMAAWPHSFVSMTETSLHVAFAGNLGTTCRTFSRDGGAWFEGAEHRLAGHVCGSLADLQWEYLDPSNGQPGTLRLLQLQGDSTVTLAETETPVAFYGVSQTSIPNGQAGSKSFLFYPQRGDAGLSLIPVWRSESGIRGVFPGYAIMENSTHSFVVSIPLDGQ